MISVLLYEKVLIGSAINRQKSSSSGYEFRIEPSKDLAPIYYMTQSEMNRYYSNLPENYKKYDDHVEFVEPISNYEFQPFLHYMQPSMMEKLRANIKQTHSPIIVSTSKRRNDDKDILKGNKKTYKDEQFKKQGSKSNKVFSSDFEYNKGKKGGYEKTFDSEKDHEEKKKLATEHDEACSDMSKHESEKKGDKSGKFNSKHQHHKGAKSKGYHNIFMKDEYKKDHTFYGLSQIKYPLVLIELNFSIIISLKTSMIIPEIIINRDRNTASTIMMNRRAKIKEQKLMEMRVKKTQKMATTLKINIISLIQNIKSNQIKNHTMQIN